MRLCVADAFAKLRRETISFVVFLYVCLSVWNFSATTGQIFTKFDICAFFLKKICRENSDKNNGYFTWRRMHIYLDDFFIEREMFRTWVVEKINIQFYFRKLCRLWHDVEERCRAGHATDNAHTVWNTIGFQRQQWLCKCATVLPYIYITCLVYGSRDNSDYSINWQAFDTETECVYYAVRTETLTIWRLTTTLVAVPHR